MDYKIKYLKYKNKYLSLKQIAGSLQVKQTAKNREYDDDNIRQTTSRLVGLDIDCRANNGINRIKLSREERDDNPVANNRIFYDYKCNTSNHYNIPNLQNSTAPNDYGSGDIRYLDRHNINCGDTEIKDIQFIKNEDGTIQYNYKCGNLTLKDFVNRETEFQETGANHNRISRNIYLDRHNINCPDEKILTRVQLQTQDGYRDIKYNYRCGRLPELKIETIQPAYNTYSFLWVPLIYCVLPDVRIEFYPEFEEDFNLINTRVNNRGGRFVLPFRNFEEYKPWCVNILRGKLGADNITRNNILHGPRINLIYTEDSNLHLASNAQNDFFSIDTAWGLPTFASSLVQHLCANRVGRQIKLYEI